MKTSHLSTFRVLPGWSDFESAHLLVNFQPLISHPSFVACIQDERSLTPSPPNHFAPKNLFDIPTKISILPHNQIINSGGRGLGHKSAIKLGASMDWSKTLVRKNNANLFTENLSTVLFHRKNTGLCFHKLRQNKKKWR